MLLCFLLCLPGQDVPSLSIAGSDTMLPLIEKWAERYMMREPGVVVETEGGGSRTGINRLISGKVDICSASRTLQPDEVKRMFQRRGSLGIRTLTAKDALSIYLHPSNPVGNLTRPQLRAIFTGRVRNWEELGGPDLPILVICRPPNSGTYLFLKEHVLGNEPYLDDSVTKPRTDAVVAAVAAEPGAIGYGGFIYGDKVAAAAIEGVAPGPDAVAEDRYPLTRYLYLYTVSPLEGKRRAFIKWVLGVEGQQVVKEVGYFPLWR